MRGGEITICPFLGELARLAEDDRHHRPADLQLGQPVGDNAAAKAVVSMSAVASDRRNTRSRLRTSR
jgi:hypothetical protein